MKVANCYEIDNLGNVTIVELTVPFESNIIHAEQRKKQRYEALLSEINSNGHDAELITIEISSRGLICKANSEKLCKLIKKVKKVSHKEFRVLKQEITKVTVIASYIIFYAKFENQWVSPSSIIV